MQALACDLKIWRTRRLINVHLNSMHCEVNDVLSEEVILRAFSPRRLNALLASAGTSDPFWTDDKAE